MNQRAKNWFFRLLHPGFWVQNYHTCAGWDAALNRMMDANLPVKQAGAYSVMLGSVPVWVANWPAAYGRHGMDGEALAYPLTRIRLRHYIANQIAEKAIAEAA